MIKKISLIILAAVLIAGGIVWYKFLTPKTGFAGERKFLYIYSNNPTKEAVLAALRNDSILTNVNDFEWLAARMKYWGKIKPGRYQIKKDETVYDVVKKLRSGNHFPVNLVINKLRMSQDLARLIGRNFETDSANVMQYLDSSGLKTFYEIIPNTYSFPWTYTPKKIFSKLNDEYEEWWKTNRRLEKAKQKGYTPSQVYIIASIVEEESNIAKDKSNIASVYFNRLEKSMPLQADPTIRYALNNFHMNRVTYADLKYNSPYNTYLNAGLPPGPICTPSPATIDTVLNAPKTDFIFFVAHANLLGGSTFTTNFADHSRAAKVYQDSLTAWMKRKAAKEKAIKDSIAKAKQS